MKKEALIQRAREYAKQKGWVVDQYVVSDFKRSRQGCWIKFDGKSKRPGDHFSVTADCSTGKGLRLVPGR